MEVFDEEQDFPARSEAGHHTAQHHCRGGIWAAPRSAGLRGNLRFRPVQSRIVPTTQPVSRRLAAGIDDVDMTRTPNKQTVYFGFWMTCIIHCEVS